MSTFVRFDACLLSIAIFVSVTGPTLSKLLSSSEQPREPSQARWTSGKQGSTKEFTLGLVRTKGSLETRRFLVPPFFNSLPGANDSNSMEDDPFAEGYVAPKAEVRDKSIEILQAHGLEFGEGASASYDRDTSTLTVTNHASQLAIVERFVANLIDEGVPRQIKGGSKFVEAQTNGIEDPSSGASSERQR